MRCTGKVIILNLFTRGLLLPLISEYTWPLESRGFVYLVALLYCFLGVAIIADIFMGAIEKITSKTKKVILNMCSFFFTIFFSLKKAWYIRDYVKEITRKTNKVRVLSFGVMLRRSPAKQRRWEWRGKGDPLKKDDSKPEDNFGLSTLPIVADYKMLPNLMSPDVVHQVLKNRGAYS